jgi:hypothetical protein
MQEFGNKYVAFTPQTINGEDVGEGLLPNVLAEFLQAHPDERTFE